MPISERDVLKADAMILATAKAAGATKFYTNDDKCRKLAILAGLQGCVIPRRDPHSLFSPKELEGAQQPAGPQTGRFSRKKKKTPEE